MAKYGRNSVWVPKDFRGTHGTGILKSILKVKIRFKEFIRFNLGTGEDIQFWDDVWCGPFALKEDFNSIFSIANVQSGLVMNFFLFEGDGAWNVSLRRNLND